MNLRCCLRPVLRLASVALFSAFTLLPTALAQQITYYDFNVPASAQAPYASCTPSSATPLVCLNNNPSLPNSAGPTYATTPYPATIDPNQQDVPPVPSSNQAVQLTQPIGSQGGSLWFRAPQKVANGFTAYFTFQITPSSYSTNTADGLAFVIQNALGHGVSGTPGSENYCTENNAGPTVTGNNGGCIGYGGIDNSVAFEFDTFANGWDPFALGAGSYNDNHIAIMSCGAGANSPVHSGPCQVYLNANTNAPQEALVNNPSGVTLADGNIHQVVITYNGPNEANPNLVQVFIDPVFVAGTHTPVAGSVPALSGVYNLTGNLNLINSAGGNSAPSLDSAYVGFTSSTGASFEQHTLLNWTFTPHTPVTLTEPLQTNGTTTVFPFGAHTYGVTYPASVNTSGISMTVTAYPISQTLFTQLINAGPFAGSQCQIYDETGGNCIVYSVSCVETATNTPMMCPAGTASDPITIKSAYNDSIVAVTPGFIQGDPFYSQVTSINGNGTTATVDCVGECAVTAGQTVTVAGSQSGGSTSAFNGTVTVVATPSPSVFTFASTVSGSATGGYLTSTNVQNIFYQQLPYRLDATTTGKTQNFSDFVVTGVTTAPTKLTISAPASPFGQPTLVTVTATSANGTPTGNVALAVDGGTPITQPLVGGTTVFTLTGLSAGTHTLTVTYGQTGTFQSGTSTGSVTVLPPAAVATVSPSSLDFGTLYLGEVKIKTVTLTNTGTAPLTISTPFIQDVGNGDSKEFIALSLCPKTLAVGASCKVYVTFLAGPAYAPQTAVLKVVDSAAGSPQLVPLTATVINPQATFTPSSIAFGNDKVGAAPLTASVVLKNTGATPLSIAGMRLTGADVGDFSFTNPCAATLNSGASCTIPLTFKPTTTGTRSAQLTVSDNAANSTQQVRLTGTGK